MNITAEPCPNAKKASGRLRRVGEPEYTCNMGCAVCRGSGTTFACETCEGCGLVLGVLCEKCRGSGRQPADRLKRA